MRSPLSLAIVLLATLASAQDVFYSARLTGDQEVPPVVTTASGWGIVRLETASNRVTCWVVATGLVGTASHLHMAPVGQNGGIILPLTGGPTRYSGSAVLAFKYIKAEGEAKTVPRTLSVGLETVESWVRAEVVNVVSVTETLLTGRATVRYDIQNAPLKEFWIQTPSRWRNVGTRQRLPGSRSLQGERATDGQGRAELVGHRGGWQGRR